MPEQTKSISESLAKSMPALGVLIGDKSLPVPTTFSAARILESYIKILQKYLTLTSHMKVSGKSTHGSDSDPDSEDEDSSKSSQVNEKKEMISFARNVERSQRIGEESYPSEHLYECE